ncbi:probable rhamnogalacturonate lyase B isoform X2 [Papaver somniferum]|nr:probable rhamnogalacturonate lyase B isoform X2 [Papaver somniferum]
MKNSIDAYVQYPYSWTKKKNSGVVLWWMAFLSVLSLSITSVESLAARNFPSVANANVKGSNSGLKLLVQGKYVVMENSFVRVNLSNPDGLVTAVQYHGIDANLLEIRDTEDSRGYWDVVWGEPGHKDYFDKLKATTFKVIVQNENQIEVSFSWKWDISLKGKLAPMNLDKRYIMLKDSSGFYTYGIFDHPKGFPEFSLAEARVAFKLSSAMFHHMTVSDTMQREMPAYEDRQKGQPLAYPEAVLLTNPINPVHKGEVDDKYMYSVENKDTGVHGWISANPRVGFWIITASSEFLVGGPHKQDLTSHAGPISLSIFFSSHYTGDELSPKFGNGEPWKKVFGPVFVYLNSAPPAEKDLYAALWKDAKAQLAKEVKSWPYSFPASDDFPAADQRGTVTGSLSVRDRYVNRLDIPGNSAYVGLAPPGEVGSWQRECKGYQFWTKANADGSFSIPNVRAGEYNLFAWVPGFIGDFKHNIIIKISPGSNQNVGKLVYEPPRDGPTLWEIGVADRSAAEFRVPEPNKNLMNRLYVDRGDWFRQYGTWEQYSQMYPTTDLVFTIGVNQHQRDWFYAHVPRKLGNKYVPTTWSIVFKIDQVLPSGTYKLRIAIASATYAELQVRVNDEKAVRPLFTTGNIGKDNAIARHGIHGLYWLYTVNVPGNLLHPGKNTIFITQTRTSMPFNGFMYDYIRLEGPPTNVA